MYVSELRSKQDDELIDLFEDLKESLYNCVSIGEQGNWWIQPSSVKHAAILPVFSPCYGNANSRQP
jgi:hypothetical protein